MREGLYRTLRVRYGAKGIRDWFGLMVGEVGVLLLKKLNLEKASNTHIVLTFLTLPFFVVTGIGIKKYKPNTYYLNNNDKILNIFLDHFVAMSKFYGFSKEEEKRLAESMFLPKSFFVYGKHYDMQDRLLKHYRPAQRYTSILEFLKYENIISDSYFVSMAKTCLDLDDVLAEKNCDTFLRPVLYEYSTKQIDKNELYRLVNNIF